jgi:hypothetical protein
LKGSYNLTLGIGLRPLKKKLEISNILILALTNQALSVIIIVIDKRYERPRRS